MDPTTIIEASAAQNSRASRRRLMAGAGMAALAAAAFATQHNAFAQAMGPGPGGPGGPRGSGPWHGHGAGMGMGMDCGMGFGGMGGMVDFDGGDPAVTARRLDAMVAYRLADVDATPEQRARISAIVQSLAKDLHGTRAKLVDLRRQSMALMGAATIDRAGMEKLRAEQMQIADTSSRRMLQAMADGAEVLTPEQRTKLMERFQSRAQQRGGMHHGGMRYGTPAQPSTR